MPTLVLQQISIVNYAEEPDYKNTLPNLLRGCLDSIVDFLYARDYPASVTPNTIEEIHENIWTQLEFTARAILIKNGVDLNTAVFSKEVNIPDTQTACIGRLLVYFGHALAQTENLDSSDYDQKYIQEFIKSLTLEAYIIITGVLQYFICQQKE